MGILLEKIARTGKAAAPRLGFGMPQSERRAAMLLIAVTAAAEPAAAAAAVASGADAILVKQAPAKPSRSRLADQLKLAAGTPCGAHANANGSDPSTCDFAILELADSIAILQSTDGLDRILRLPADISSATLRTLEALPADAYALAAPGEPLSIERLLPFYRVSAATRKPLLTWVSSTATRDTLIALRDAGVSGVLVEGTPKQLAALHQLLLDLPTRKPRGEGSRPSVKLGLPPYNEPAPAADDDGDDDEDDEG
ncbi:MAG: hypothetical protein EXR49_09395 [Dehalococcoidia bacterium]|nr:hypothetical protein [Dehalococcoidia bacterium]